MEKGITTLFQQSQNLGFDTIPNMPTSKIMIMILDVGYFFAQILNANDYHLHFFLNANDYHLHFFEGRLNLRQSEYLK
jgi:hypothetical protein